jgi:hypothetical protein
MSIAYNGSLSFCGEWLGLGCDRGWLEAAVAVEAEAGGRLWSWGCNISKRAQLMHVVQNGQIEFLRWYATCGVS